VNDLDRIERLAELAVLAGDNARLGRAIDALDVAIASRFPARACERDLDEQLRALAVRQLADDARCPRQERRRMNASRSSLGVATIVCDGSAACDAAEHVHGCFADKGTCDQPLEHAAGRPVYDKTTGEYLGQA
jgi:hypothetical protein